MPQDDLSRTQEYMSVNFNALSRSTELWTFPASYLKHGTSTNT